MKIKRESSRDPEGSEVGGGLREVGGGGDLTEGQGPGTGVP